jgi:LysR family cyn operon transcriptional activator
LENFITEIRQLRYFLNIAQTEHLTTSAENLFVSQSTLSHGLLQLGTQLFERLGRRLKLSQAGAEFRVYASRVLKEIEASRMALADLSGLQSGKLTVGAFPTFLNTVVPATVAVFNRAHPKVTIAIPGRNARLAYRAAAAVQKLAVASRRPCRTAGAWRS